MGALRQLALASLMLLGLCGNARASDGAVLGDHLDGSQALDLAPAATMSLVASPNVVPANGISSRLLTATLTDMAGRPLTGMPVAVVGQGGNLLLSPNAAVTNCLGQASFSVAATSTLPQIVWGYGLGLPLARTPLSFACPGTFQAAQSWPTLGARNAAGLNAAAGDVNGDGRVDLLVANASAQAFSVLLGYGNGYFAPQLTVGTSSSPAHVVLGDFNGDGNQDVAVGFYGTAGGQIFVNNGTAGFTASASFAPSAGLRSMVAADFNQDGKLDLAVAPQLAANSLNVFYGNGNGTLQSANVVTIGNGPIQIATADFNQDGFPDLVAACYTGGLVSLVLGQKNGFGTASTVTSLGGVGGVAAGDLNLDGLVDLVAVGSSNLLTFLGKGNGTFQSPNSYVTPNPQSAGNTFASLLDLNKDGRMDLAINTSVGAYTYLATAPNGSLAAPVLSAVFGGTGSAPVAGDFNGDGSVDLAQPTPAFNMGVFVNNGSGVLAPTTNPILQTSPTASAVADLNKDGKLDVVTANAGSASLSVTLGNGNGTLQQAFHLAVGPTPRAVVIADFNNDGNLDLASANNGNNTVSLLLGNGNGTFGAATSYSVGSAPVALVAADFDKDGKVDLAVAA